MQRARIVLIAVGAALAVGTAAWAAFSMSARSGQEAAGAPSEVTVEIPSAAGPTSIAMVDGPAALDPGARRDDAGSGRDAGAAGDPEASAGMYVQNPHAATLPAEMAALGAARFFVKRGELERALAQLERLAERVPDGALRAERTAELAVVQCGLGRRALGRRSLASLQRMSPAAPAALIERARAACEQAASPRGATAR